MPHRINGIGKWYVGRDNQHSHRSSCEHCGNFTDLVSYDTTKFFTVVFLPLIPLGKQRVIDQCSSCTRHASMKLADWETAREESVREAVAAYRAAPRDVDRAADAVQATVAFQHPGAFRTLSRAIESDLSDSAPMLQMLGDAHGFFGHEDEAGACYRKAVSLGDDDGLRERLGLHLVQRLEPGEARGYLWHIIQRADAERAGLLYLLVEAYQAKGLHQDALQVLDEMRRVFPGIEEEKEFKKYRKSAEKNQVSGRAVASKNLALSPSSAGSGARGMSGRGAHLLAAALVVLLAVALGGFVIRRTGSHEVHLVNGLDRPYEMTIGDESHGVGAKAVQAVRLPKGEDLRVVVRGLEPSPEPVDFRIEIPFWQALFSKRVFVVNPDRAGIVVWEQTEYATTPDPNQELPFRVHVGEPFYEFAGVDYVFRDFPAEISLSSSTERARRDRVYLESTLSSFEGYTALLTLDVAPETAEEYLRSLVRFGADDLLAYRLLAATSSEDEPRALAGRHLETRPLEMDWHRVYQEALQAAGREEEVVREYRALLEAEPDNLDLQYLLARVVPDPDESERLLAGASGAAAPSAYALHGLAYQRLVEGRFTEALEHARRARELDPANEAFLYPEESALLGTEQYRTLLDRRLAQRKTMPYEGSLALEEVQLRAALGDPDGAGKAMEAYLATLARDPDIDAETRAYWQAYLEGALHHARGDHPAFAASRAGLPGNEPAIEAALCGGELAEAARLAGEEGAPAVTHLLLYVAAERKGLRALAREQLASALEQLEHGAPDERRLADAFRGRISVDRALRLSLPPADKAVALTALAMRTGDRRYRELAKKLNFGLDFQAVFLARVMDG